MGIRIQNVEIFRVGSESADGVPRSETITEAHLRDIAATYSTTLHPAPLTTDHDQWGAAKGWCENVVARGKRLFCDFVDVLPEFYAEMKSGKWKNRSVEVYLPFSATGKPYLKAVTMLGAMPPACKGMEPIKFSDPGAFSAFASDELDPVEFYSDAEVSTPANGPAVAPIKEEDRMPDPAPQGAAPPAALPPDVLAKFAEFEASLATERKAREAAEASAAASSKAVEDLKAALFSERETARFDSAFKAALSEGRATPGNRPTALAIFSALPASGDVVKFGESEGSARDAYLHALATAPVVVEFRDALPPREPRAPVSGRDAMDAAAKARAKEKNITFSEALVEIVNEKEGC